MKVRKVVALVALALLLFYVIKAPYEAADNVGEFISWLGQGAEAIITFVLNVFE